MENAAEALKIGFGVIVFATALAVLFRMSSIIRSTSDEVFVSIDKTTYIDYSVDTSSISNDGKRIVSFSDIIPTIYRYSQEGYGVTIIDNDEIVARFDLDTEYQVQSCRWKINEHNKSSTANKTKNNTQKLRLLQYLYNNIYSIAGISKPELNGINDITDIGTDYDGKNNELRSLNTIIPKIYSTGDGNEVFTGWLVANTNSNNIISQRIDCDLHGGTTYFNTKYPGVSNASLTDNIGKHRAVNNGNGLMSKYSEVKFKEYITEQDPNAYVIVDNKETDLLQYGTIRYAKKREIIYVKVD